MHYFSWQLQEPQMNLPMLLDLNGEQRDLYVIGLQEAPRFSGEETIGNLLGDTYWYVTWICLHGVKIY